MTTHHQLRNLSQVGCSCNWSRVFAYLGCWQYSYILGKFDLHKTVWKCIQAMAWDRVPSMSSTRQSRTIARSPVAQTLIRQFCDHQDFCNAVNRRIWATKSPDKWDGFGTGVWERITNVEMGAELSLKTATQVHKLTGLLSYCVPDVLILVTQVIRAKCC